MTTRSLIFISAVTHELRTARQLAANTLRFLGYESDWQEVFGTEHGDLRAMLRKRIDAAEGVVQLIGHCYGAEPPSADKTFGRVSYTHYEALYARDRGKKVWYLLLEETFPADPHASEPQELRELQRSYREQIRSEKHIYHLLESREALEANILKLRDELAELRRRVRRWTMALAAVLVSVAAGVALLLQGQHRQAQKLEAVNDSLAKLRSYPAFTSVAPRQLPDTLQTRFDAELERLVRKSFAAGPMQTYQVTAPSINEYDVPISSGVQYAIIVGATPTVRFLGAYAFNESGEPVSSEESVAGLLTLEYRASETGSLQVIVEAKDIDSIGQINVAVARRWAH